MPKYRTFSRSLAAFDQNSTLVAVIEMGSEGWLVGTLVPGLKKDPRERLSPDKQSLLALLHRWCAEAAKAGHAIKQGLCRKGRNSSPSGVFRRLTMGPACVNGGIRPKAGYSALPCLPVRT